MINNKVDLGWYFLIYAFPALEGCARVDERKRSELEQIILNKNSIEEKELIEIFPDAFRRMREKLGEDYWTVENIRKYWWIEHNKIINNNEKGYENALHEHKEICKVKFWQVVEISDRKIFLRDKNNGTINAFNYRGIKLNLGDYVTTHKNQVIEDISQHDFLKYG